jgi:PRTRC genetic system protein B
VKFSIEETAPRAFTLERAILLYREGTDTLAVEHAVREKKDSGAYLGAGRFVTRGVVEGLLRVMDQSPLRYVAPNVVAMGHRSIAWFEPAAMRMMFFRPDRDAAVAAFDGKPVPQPPLLFIAREGRLRVFALFENERPTLETPLAMAPYWNVYASRDHEVCLGTMAVPACLELAATADWTSAFFRSEFTHLSGAKCWAHPGTYAELLADAVAAGRFNAQWLCSANQTVGEALQQGRR